MSATDLLRDASGELDLSPEAILSHEQALLDALLDPAQQREAFAKTMSVPRIRVSTGRKLTDGEPETVPLSWRFLPMLEPERRAAERAATTQRQVRGPAGQQLESTLNDAWFKAEMIVRSAHPDDVARLWRSRALQKAKGVPDGLAADAAARELVLRWLWSGEIALCVAAIVKASGFSDDLFGLSKSDDPDDGLDQ